MGSRPRYALFFVIAAAPLVDVGHVKPAPLFMAASLFALHALLSLVMRSEERATVRDILSALLLLGCFVVSAMLLLTWLAMIVARPVTPDGHRVMPIGQVFLGLAGGGVVGALITYAALRPAGRDRRLERMLLHGVGVVVVVAAVTACVRG